MKSKRWPFYSQVLVAVISVIMIVYMNIPSSFLNANAFMLVFQNIGLASMLFELVFALPIGAVGLYQSIKNADEIDYEVATFLLSFVSIFIGITAISVTVFIFLLV